MYVPAQIQLENEWYPWHQDPQQPQWPRLPHFIKKLTELDVYINPSTKTTLPGLSLWNGSSKFLYFFYFWHSVCWRPWMLPLTKFEDHKSNAISLETCWKPLTIFEFIRTYSNIGLDNLSHFALDDPVVGITYSIDISNQISFFSRNVILWTLSIQIRKIPSFIKYLGLNRGRKQKTSSIKVRYSEKATKIWKILPPFFWRY